MIAMYTPPIDQLLLPANTLWLGVVVADDDTKQSGAKQPQQRLTSRDDGEVECW